MCIAANSSRDRGRRKQQARDAYGSGSAMAALIDNTVIVTTRQSDNVPNASEVAMAPSSLGDATGARLPSKPIVPDNRIMGPFPCGSGPNHPPSREFCNHHRQHCGGSDSENGLIGAKVNVMPDKINL
jgi:hypothetical protein